MVEEVIDIETYYCDQSFESVSYGYIHFGSGYTPHGVHAIDGNFIARIMNFGIPVKKVQNIERIISTYCEVKTREEKEFYLDYHTWYVDKPIDFFSAGYGLRVIWESGHQRDFYQGGNGTYPKFNLETGLESAVQIARDIADCPVLHEKIKENLYSNLECYNNA